MLRFKSCRNGRFYGAVDPMLILQSLREFAVERSDYRRKYEEEMERQRSLAEDAYWRGLRARHKARCADAATGSLILDFNQYHLMGCEEMTDGQLREVLDAVTGGALRPPESPFKICDYIREKPLADRLAQILPTPNPS